MCVWFASGYALQLATCLFEADVCRNGCVTIRSLAPGTYTMVMFGEDGTEANTALASQEPTSVLHSCLLKERCAFLFCDIPDVRTALSESQDLCPAPLGQLIVTSALTRAKATSSLPRSRAPQPWPSRARLVSGQPSRSPAPKSWQRLFFFLNEISFRYTARWLDVSIVHKTIPAVAPTPPQLSGRPPTPPGPYLLAMGESSV